VSAVPHEASRLWNWCRPFSPPAAVNSVGNCCATRALSMLQLTKPRVRRFDTPCQRGGRASMTCSVTGTAQRGEPRICQLSVGDSPRSADATATANPAAALSVPAQPRVLRHRPRFAVAQPSRPVPPGASKFGGFGWPFEWGTRAGRHGGDLSHRQGIAGSISATLVVGPGGSRGRAWTVVAVCVVRDVAPAWASKTLA
jgi:hypothetical protein